MDKTGFPRGGKLKKKDESSNKPEMGLFQDVSQKASKTKGDKKGNKSKKDSSAREKKGKEDDPIESLRQEDLEPHMLLLGRVREVHDLQLMMSLPCMLVGAVPITNVSPVLTQQLQTNSQQCLSSLFTPGQYLTCMVTQTDMTGHKVRNTLSISPSDINGTLSVSLLQPGLLLQCSVRSDEECVYDMDCGIPGTRAVLPKHALGKQPRQLLGGQVLWCLVDSVTTHDDVYTLTLTCDPGRVNAAEVTAQSGITPQTLLPGMRVPVTVTAVCRRGLQLSYLTDRAAFVYKLHLDEPLDVPDDYNVGATTHGRVLYTLPTVRRTYVTLRPDVGRLPAAPLQLSGSAPEAGQVVDVDGRGLRVALPDGRAGFCPVWNVVKPTDGSALKPDQTVQCWPVVYDAMDGLHIVSMKSSTKPSALSSYEAGQRVTGSVTEVTKQGCLVQINKTRVGFIPLNHLTSFPVPDVQAKFPPGKKLKCKVISVDARRSRLILTHNPRLVRGDTALMGPEQLQLPGSSGLMMAFKTTEKGVVMTGYGGAKGFIRASCLEPGFAESYYPGRLVRCEVKAAVWRDGRVRAVLRPLAENAASSEVVDVRGRQYTGTVTARRPGVLVVQLDGGPEAELPAHHLTDVPEHAEAALVRHKVGDSLQLVGVASLAQKNIVSAKPSFVQAVQDGVYPDDEEAISVGMTLPCVVSSYSESGVRVVFPCPALPRTYGILARYLGDGWHTETSGLRKLVGRTLLARIVAVASEERRYPVLSARMDRTDAGQGVLYLRRCLNELGRLTATSRHGPGATVSAVITQLDAAGGAVVRTDDGAVGVLPAPSDDAGGQLQVGHQLTAAVVRVTPAGQLVLTRHQLVTVGCQLGVDRGDRCAARVLSTDSGYCVYACLQPPAPPCIVHLPSRLSINDVAGAVKTPPAVGTDIHVQIKSCKGGAIVAVTSQSPSSTSAKRQRAASAKPSPSRVRRKRAGSQHRPAPKRSKPTAIVYSRFSLKDESL